MALVEVGNLDPDRHRAVIFQVDKGVNADLLVERTDLVLEQIEGFARGRGIKNRGGQIVKKIKQSYPWSQMPFQIKWWLKGAIKRVNDSIGRVFRCTSVTKVLQ